jgi:hypothetical protein
MKDRAVNDEPEAVAAERDKRTWVDPEISVPKERIGYPDGLILQGGEGSVW